MRRAKAPIAIGVAVLAVLGGGIAALADEDSSKAKHLLARQPAGAAPQGALAAPEAAQSTASAVPAAARAACGAETAAVVAKVDGQVAERIYSAELHSTAT